jgi:hypothetical protein
MKDIQVLDCLQPEIVTLERVNYFPRQLLTVDDMVTERDYMLQKLRRHNRYLHGWGVVCGLEVKAAATAQKPWQVRISAGYALGPYGDEIHVAQAVFLDLEKCGPNAMTDPCEPGRLRAAPRGVGVTVYVAIKYAECLARPVKAMPAGCGCEDDPCEYSRIRDSFQVTCLTELPPSHRPPKQPTLCEIISGKLITACPPCPEDPWVVLAEVTLPVAPATAIADGGIDNIRVRRVVFSTALIQDQLIRCCCGERQPPPPPPEASANLAIRQDGTLTEVPAAAALEGRAFRFDIFVDNMGPSAANNVVLKVKTTPPLDAGGYLFLPDAAWTKVPDGPGIGLTRNLGTMAPNATQTFSYMAVIRNPQTPITSVASVSTSTNDPNQANNEVHTTKSV